MDDDDVVVTVEEETAAPETPVAVEPEPKPTSAPIDDFKKQYEELKVRAEKFQADRAAAFQREQNERNARLAAEQETDVTRSEILQTRLATVDSNLSAAQAEATAAKSEYVAAQEAGDWKRAGDANERLADARARVVQLTADKNYWESQPAPQPRQAPPPPQQQPTGDPIEAFISQKPEKSANWLREHKDWLTDERKRFKLAAAHNDAVSELGETAVESPAYFAHVEKFLGLQKATEVKPRRSVPPPVLPVGPSGSGASGGYEVHLTKGEAERASDGTLVWNYDDPSGKKRWKKGDPLGKEEFAKRKRAMMASGVYDKIYTEGQ